MILDWGVDSTYFWLCVYQNILTDLHDSQERKVTVCSGIYPGTEACTNGIP